MRIFRSAVRSRFSGIQVNPSWNMGGEKELLMHRIHAYPAKFPAFLVSKAIEIAEKKKIRVQRIADVFCGCGTTALEARKQDLQFWGCDINPVAVLIAKVKSGKYQIDRLEFYLEKILTKYAKLKARKHNPYLKSERIRYWFPDEQINDLDRLLRAIRSEVPTGSYRNFFLCAFSNILKATSVWLTKSIKPQVDPLKLPSNVNQAFVKQSRFMIKAATQCNALLKNKAHSQIVIGNFLERKIPSQHVDMLITSPPYVTSYEYADLHQLSTLWLGYTSDYKTLRKGTIGSLYFEDKNDSNWQKLSPFGKSIFLKLYGKDKRKAGCVAKYFHDLHESVIRSFKLLKRRGIAVYVIGNTEYLGIKVDNARFLAESMKKAGYKDFQIFKRKISSKILTPNRNKRGRFCRDTNARQVYGHEFVIIGTKSDDRSKRSK